MEICRKSWVVLFGCWRLAVKEAEPVGSLPCWNCVLGGIREGLSVSTLTQTRWVLRNTSALQALCAELKWPLDQTPGKGCQGRRCAAGIALLGLIFTGWCLLLWALL